MRRGTESKGHRGAAFSVQRSQPWGCDPVNVLPMGHSSWDRALGGKQQVERGTYVCLCRGWQGMDPSPHWAEMDAWREKQR